MKIQSIYYKNQGKKFCFFMNTQDSWSDFLSNGISFRRNVIILKFPLFFLPKKKNCSIYYAKYSLISDFKSL